MKKGNKIILSVIACFTLTTGLYADINKIKDLEPLKEKEILENPEKYSQYQNPNLKTKSVIGEPFKDTNFSSNSKKDNVKEVINKEEFFVGKKSSVFVSNNAVNEEVKKEAIPEEKKLTVQNISSDIENKDKKDDNSNVETLIKDKKAEKAKKIKKVKEVKVNEKEEIKSQAPVKEIVVDKKSEEVNELEVILSENKNLENKVNELKLFLNNDLTKMKTEIEDKNKKITKIVSEKTKTIDDLKIKEQNLIKNNKDMETKIATLESNIKELEKTNKINSDEITKLNKERENLSRTISKEKDEEIKKMVKEKELLIDNNNKKLRELEKTTALKDTEIRNLNKKIQSLEDSIKSKSDDFIEDSKRAKVKNDELESRLQLMAKENKTLKEENGDILKLKDENNKIRELTIEQVQTISNLKDKVASFENNTLLNDLKKEVELLKTKNLELEITLKNRNNLQLKPNYNKQEYQDLEYKGKTTQKNNYEEDNEENIVEPQKAYKSNEKFIDMKDLNSLFDEINEK